MNKLKNFLIKLNFIKIESSSIIQINWTSTYVLFAQLGHLNEHKYSISYSLVILDMKILNNFMLLL